MNIIQAVMPYQRAYNQFLSLQHETIVAGWEVTRAIDENAREDAPWEAYMDQNPAGDW